MEKYIYVGESNSNMELEKRKVNKVGTSLAIYLSKYAKKIGIDEGDYVNIVADDDRIVIFPENSADHLKPIRFDKKLWNEFVGTIVNVYGRNFATNDANIIKCLEEAVKMWIKKKSSIWEKPIIRF